MLGAVARTVAFAAAVIATVGFLSALFAATDADKELVAPVSGLVLFALFCAFFLRGENFNWDGDGRD